MKNLININDWQNKKDFYYEQDIISRYLINNIYILNDYVYDINTLSDLEKKIDKATDLIETDDDIHEFFTCNFQKITTKRNNYRKNTIDYVALIFIISSCPKDNYINIKDYNLDFALEMVEDNWIMLETLVALIEKNENVNEGFDVLRQDYRKDNIVYLNKKM